MNPMDVDAAITTTQVLLQGNQLDELLRILHIIGISMGLGGSLFADYMSLDMLMLPGKNGTVEAKTLARVHWFIFSGLALIWVSGIGIALGKFTWATVPDKLIIKLVVVTALSANAIMIGRYLIPISKKYTAPILRYMTPRDMNTSAFIIGISLTCWFSALFVSKVVALQQLPISTMLFVILGSYFVLFLGIRGFLSYTKMVLMVNQQEEPDHTSGSAVFSPSMPTSSAPEATAWGGDVEYRGAAAHKPSSLAQSSTELHQQKTKRTLVNTSVNPSGLRRREEDKKQPASKGAMSLDLGKAVRPKTIPSPPFDRFARNMTFHFVADHFEYIHPERATHFSQAFANASLPLPWSSTLAYTSQRAKIQGISVFYSGSKRGAPRRKSAEVTAAASARRKLAPSVSVPASTTDASAHAQTHHTMPPISPVPTGTPLSGGRRTLAAANRQVLEEELGLGAADTIPSSGSEMRPLRGKTPLVAKYSL